MISLVVVIWGANFSIAKMGVAEVPPLFLAGLRYLLAAIPAVFLIPRPAISWRYWVPYGLTVGLGQFGCLFYAMHLGMPAGVASVVLQSQAFFTVTIAFLFLGERLSLVQVMGIAVASAGLYLTAQGEEVAGTSASLAAFGLAVAGAASWGVSNVIVRVASRQLPTTGKPLDPLSLVAWSSLVPPLPLFALSALTASDTSLMDTIVELPAAPLLAAMFMAYGATLFCYGTWSRLLSRYDTARVAPASLLVPVTGLLTAWVILGERLAPPQWLGCALVLSGLGLTFTNPAAGARSPAVSRE